MVKNVALCAAALILTATACSDSSGPTAATSFESALTADLAVSAGEAVATDLDFIAGAENSQAGAAFALDVGQQGPPPGGGGGAGIGGGSFMWINPACTYSSTTQRFNCPTVTRLGHTHSVSYSLFDASNVAQSAYDATTTASIRFTVSDTGAIAHTNDGFSFSDTSSRHRTETVRGLQGDPDTVHTWNGTGTSSIKSTRTGGSKSRSYMYTSNDTITNLRIKMPRAQNQYPLSGTIVHNYTAVRTDTSTTTVTRRVVVTFNGTSTAQMTVGSDEFTINLDNRRVARRQQRR